MTLETISVFLSVGLILLLIFSAIVSFITYKIKQSSHTKLAKAVKVNPIPAYVKVTNSRNSATIDSYEFRNTNSNSSVNAALTNQTNRATQKSLRSYEIKPSRYQVVNYAYVGGSSFNRSKIGFN